MKDTENLEFTWSNMNELKDKNKYQKIYLTWHTQITFFQYFANRIWWMRISSVFNSKNRNKLTVYNYVNQIIVINVNSEWL